MKIIQFSAENSLNTIDAAQQEISVMEKFSNKDITMNLIAYEIKQECVYIVMELGDLDLRTFMNQYVKISEHRIGALLEDMCNCVLVMHNMGFIHTDLKP